jgi:UDP-glucose 4-epimerase
VIPPTPDAPTLVVGAGGLLGSAVVRELRRRGLPVMTARVHWDGPDADADLAAALAGVVAAGGPWRVAWCAGAGVTATPQPVLDAELATLRRFADAVAATGAADLGTIFYASSAGGVYAGSAEPPFDEGSPVGPLAPYGWAKLAAEEVLGALAGPGGAGTRVVVGRIANIYGPGQNLGKPQGLISQLCLAHHTAQPVGIYVSLDTIRDYLFADDCAAVVVDLLDRASRLEHGAPAVTKVVASQQSVTIAALLGELRRITKRRPPVVLAASPYRRVQARDLRFRSQVWPDLDRRALVSLPHGVAATAEDIGRRWRAGALAR